MAVWADHKFGLDAALTVRADVFFLKVAPQIFFFERALVFLGQGLARPQDHMQNNAGEWQKQRKRDSQHLHDDIIAARMDVAIRPEHRRGP